MASPTKETAVNKELFWCGLQLAEGIRKLEAMIVDRHMLRRRSNRLALALLFLGILLFALQLGQISKHAGISHYEKVQLTRMLDALR